MKRDIWHKQSGFTIAELMVAVVFSAVLIAAMYQTFYVQQKSYLRQNYLTEIQQNLRSGMYFMTKDIHSVGYNPQTRATVGFVTSFPAPNDTFVINYATANNIIALTADTDGNGIVEVKSTEAISTEQIAYRLNAANRTLERFKSAPVLPLGGVGVWEAVIDNVDAVNFVYLKGDGTLATQASDIRSVEIALLVRARQPEPKFLNTTTYRNKQGTIICATCTGDHYYRRLLTTTVQARNLR